VPNVAKANLVAKFRESSVASAFRSRSSSRSEHPRKLVDTLAQGFERRVDRSLFLYNVRKACILHFFGSRFEALAAHGIHRKEGECLRKRYAVRSGMQKFNVCIHFPEYGSKGDPGLLSNLCCPG
jgi:hypothetical protein